MGDRSERLYAIDWLRGIVMVLMALDHCRDYFGDFRVNPTAVPDTTVALFFTRWVTHFCAPVFVFLAGTAAWLYGSRGRSKGDLSRFLWTRGLWLIVLEFTVIYFAWTGSFAVGIFFLQVIAAIGAAMIVLAGLVRFSTRTVGIVGLVIVAGHNLLDPIVPADLGAAGWVWRLLHEGSMTDFVFLPFVGGTLMVIYPLLPWIGVMALGYGFGPWTRGEPAERRARFFRLGLALTAAFVVLRAVNLYGDPTPWAVQESPVMTALSFLNTQKYPPSLLFLLMTLGPAILALGILDREPGALGRLLVVFGRVPLFYYVAHIALINVSSQLFHKLAYGWGFSAMSDGFKAFQGRAVFPPWYGHPLWVVYLSWILVVCALYPLCAWYAGVKQRSRSSLLSYL